MKFWPPFAMFVFSNQPVGGTIWLGFATSALIGSYGENGHIGPHIGQWNVSFLVALFVDNDESTHYRPTDCCNLNKTTFTSLFLQNKQTKLVHMVGLILLYHLHRLIGRLVIINTWNAWAKEPSIGKTETHVFTLSLRGGVEVVINN